MIKNCPVGMIAYKVRDELEKLAGSQKIKDALIIGEARSCKALLKATAQHLKNYGFKNVDYKDEGGIIPIRESIVDAYRFLARDESSLLGWRILGNPTEAEARKKHIRNARTLRAIIDGTPSEVGKLTDADILQVEDEIEAWEIPTNERCRVDADAGDAKLLRRREQDLEIRRGVLARELKRANLYLPRPLCNLDITVCNILNAKGLGADIVFFIGFDQGKFPKEDEPTDNETFQMLVAVTRAKKRLYLINTVGKKVSRFLGCLDPAHLDIEEIKAKPPKSDQESALPKKSGRVASGS